MNAHRNQADQDRRAPHEPAADRSDETNPTAADHETGRQGAPYILADQGRTLPVSACSHGEIRTMSDEMNFYTRKWVRPEDLNAHHTLFGGSLLRWIDDEAVVYATIQLGNTHVVTKYMSEINFVSSAVLGDIIEIGLIAVEFGRTSLTMKAHVRNIVTRKSILTVDRIVFVGLDERGEPVPHGYTDITHVRDRFPSRDGD